MAEDIIYNLPGPGADGYKAINWTTDTIADGGMMFDDTIKPAFSSLAYLNQRSDNLQTQLDNLSAATDVIAVFPDYQSFVDCSSGTGVLSGLTDLDVIKILDCEAVIEGSSFSGEQVYFQYHKDRDEWDFLGSLSPYYSKTEIDAMTAQIEGNSITSIDVSSDDYLSASTSSITSDAGKAYTINIGATDDFVSSVGSGVSAYNDLTSAKWFSGVSAGTGVVSANGKNDLLSLSAGLNIEYIVTADNVLGIKTSDNLSAQDITATNITANNIYATGTNDGVSGRYISATYYSGNVVHHDDNNLIIGDDGWRTNTRGNTQSAVGNSTAFGKKVSANTESFAVNFVGTSSTIASARSFAIGDNTIAEYISCVIGDTNSANGTSFIFGNSNTATAGSVAIGFFNTAEKNGFSVGMGNNANSAQFIFGSYSFDNSKFYSNDTPVLTLARGDNSAQRNNLLWFNKNRDLHLCKITSNTITSNYYGGENEPFYCKITDTYIKGGVGYSRCLENTDPNFNTKDIYPINNTKLFFKQTDVYDTNIALDWNSVGVQNPIQANTILLTQKDANSAELIQICLDPNSKDESKITTFYQCRNQVSSKALDLYIPNINRTDGNESHYYILLNGFRHEFSVTQGEPALTGFIIQYTDSIESQAPTITGWSNPTDMADGCFYITNFDVYSASQTEFFTNTFSACKYDSAQNYNNSKYLRIYHPIWPYRDKITIQVDGIAKRFIITKGGV